MQKKKSRSLKWRIHYARHERSRHGDVKMTIAIKEKEKSANMTIRNNDRYHTQGIINGQRSGREQSTPKPDEVETDY